MARPQVADGGNGLQIRRVGANILNKQSGKADGGWASSLGVGQGPTTPHRKTSHLLRNITESLGPGRILWHDLSTVGGACGTHGIEEKSVQGFGAKARRKEITRTTKA
jgi:hypothetical protein